AFQRWQWPTPAAAACAGEQNRSRPPASSARGPVALDADALATWGSIGRLGGNDFEGIVFAKHPDVRTLYERMAEPGPIWVRLCGAGSAIAAVYKKESERDDDVQRLGETR